MSDAWTAPDLAGQVAVVTGASRGVGRGNAEVLGGCGATAVRVHRHERSPPRSHLGVDGRQPHLLGDGDDDVSLPVAYLAAQQAAAACIDE